MAGSDQVSGSSMRRGLARNIACLAGSYVILMCLFALDLNSFFIGDDIAGLCKSAPQAGAGWIDIWLPHGNGFWRPTYLIFERLSATWFGLSPLAFHLFALIAPAAAAMLTGILAARIWPRSLWAPWLACLLMTCHILTWFVGITLANSNDSLLAVGILTGLICWDHWLESRRGRWLVGVALGFLWAIASKETGVIFPVILTLWTIGMGRWSRPAWDKLLWFWAAAFVFGLVMAYLQMTNKSSYTSVGFFSLSPKNFLRQLTDYYDSLFVPYLHLIDWPIVTITLPSAVYWGLRIVTAIALAAIVWRFVRLRGARPVTMLLVMAIVPLLLAALMRDKPQGRFAYPSLPFIVLAIVGWMHSRYWKIVTACVAVLWIAFIASFYASKDIASRRNLAAPIGRYTTALKAEALSWMPGATVAIFNHPQPGPEPWKSIYAQLHADLFLHDKHAKIILDRTDKADYAYRYEDPKLIKFVVPPSGGKSDSHIPPEGGTTNP